jgi:hypothetical protein
MIVALLAANALTAPAWAHGDDFGAGALLGLGVGALLGAAGSMCRSAGLRRATTGGGV